MEPVAALCDLDGCEDIDGGEDEVGGSDNGADVCADADSSSEARPTSSSASSASQGSSASSASVGSSTSSRSSSIPSSSTSSSASEGSGSEAESDDSCVMPSHILGNPVKVEAHHARGDSGLRVKCPHHAYCQQYRSFKMWRGKLAIALLIYILISLDPEWQRPRDEACS